ncbi:MAG: NACHT domain-containing protein [Acidobacteriota bacterium]
MFLIDPRVALVLDDMDSGPDRYGKQERLDQFKRRVTADRMPAYFTEETLQAKVLDSLLKWKAAKEAERSAGPNEPKPAEPENAFETQLVTYEDRLRSRYESLPVAGFKTQVRVPVRLDQLYVPLNAHVDLRATSKADLAESAEAAERLRGESVSVPLTEAFPQADERDRCGLALLGDPGSGKTTQLKRMLLWLLDRQPETIGLPAEMLPVFLPLRYHRDVGAGLEAFLQDQLEGKREEGGHGMPEGFAQRLLVRGNLLLLFDGLDEAANRDERKLVSRQSHSLRRSVRAAKSWSPVAMPAMTTRFAYRSSSSSSICDRSRRSKRSSSSAPGTASWSSTSPPTARRPRRKPSARPTSSSSACANRTFAPPESSR